MRRDEIYDHLAQVYLGKSLQNKAAEKRKKRQFHSWLTINIVITFIIFASPFYGLTAFLKQRSTSFPSHVLFSIHRGPIQLEYNFKNAVLPEKSFSLSIPSIEIDRYKYIQFSIRAKEEGSPGVVKIVMRTQRNEEAYFYIRDVQFHWKEFSIPLSEFHQISDWSSLKDISFVLEPWNVEDKTGVILIDDISFSS